MFFLKKKEEGKKRGGGEKHGERRPFLLNRNKMFKYRMYEFEIWCFPLLDADGVKKIHFAASAI